jgi:hypothetical protein
VGTTAASVKQALRATRARSAAHLLTLRMAQKCVPLLSLPPFAIEAQLRTLIRALESCATASKILIRRQTAPAVKLIILVMIVRLSVESYVPTPAGSVNRLGALARKVKVV